MRRLSWLLPLLATAALAQPVPMTPLRLAVIHKATAPSLADGGCVFGTSPDVLADDTGVVYTCIDDVSDNYAPMPFAIQDPTSGYKAIFDTQYLTDADRTFTFPNRAGTFWVDGLDYGSGLSAIEDPVLSWTPFAASKVPGFKVWTVPTSGSPGYFQFVMDDTTGTVTATVDAGSLDGQTGKWKFASADTAEPIVEVDGYLKATRFNLVTITQPATAATLTIANNATLSVSQSATLSDNGTYYLPNDTAYAAGWDADTKAPTKNAVYDKIETLPTKAYVDLAVASLDLDEFFSHTADALGGIYYVMDTVESTAGTVVSPTITSSTTTAIFNWITPAGHPHLTRLIAGVYDVHAHLKYTKATGSARTTTVYCELYTTDAAGGTQVKVGTSAATEALTDADAFYDIYMTLGTEVTMATTDRLALKWLAVTTGGTADTTVTQTVGGTADPHFSISIQGHELDQIFVPYAGATHDLDMGSYNITGYKKDNVSATDKLLGRSSSGAGAIEEIACDATCRGLLDDTTAAAQRATVGAAYAIPIGGMGSGAGGFSPADGTTYFFGPGGVPTTTNGIRRVYFRRAGIIRIAEVSWVSVVAAGTNETITIYLRLNDTTDTTIAAVSDTNNFKAFSNAAIDVTVAAGDYIEIKFVCPTWTTNPTGVAFGGYLLVE